MKMFQQNAVKHDSQSRFRMRAVSDAYFRDMSNQLGFHRDDHLAMRNNILRNFGFHLVANLEFLGLERLAQFHKHVRAFGLHRFRRGAGRYRASGCLSRFGWDRPIELNFLHLQEARKIEACHLPAIVAR